MNKILLPEWAEQQCILMALPNHETDWAPYLEEARQQYMDIISSFSSCGIKVLLLCGSKDEDAKLFNSIPEENLILCQCEYNDTWTRDYGPITILQDGFIKGLDFGFNGWGLKFAACFDNLVNLSLSTNYNFFPIVKYSNKRDFILEGGSIESDGEGLILTTSRCLCSPNRNGGLSKKEAEKRLKDLLGAIKVLFLDHGYLEGDDTDSHIDTLARLVPGNKILFTSCEEIDDPHFEELKLMKNQLETFTNLNDEPFALLALPLPDPIYDKEGYRLPATYANYLVASGHVFVPTYYQAEKDERALKVIGEAFPNYNIIPIDCRVLIRQHGSLHCATMQIPKGLFDDSLFTQKFF